MKKELIHEKVTETLSGRSDEAKFCMAALLFFFSAESPSSDTGWQDFFKNYIDLKHHQILNCQQFVLFHYFMAHGGHYYCFRIKIFFK